MFAPTVPVASRAEPVPLGRTIAVIRMATSVFFLFFGEYKVFDPGFAHGGFQEYLRGYIGGSAVALYRPILANLVLPHAVFFGYAVGVLELFIGLWLSGFLCEPDPYWACCT